MILYRLQCDSGHEFEAWFPSIAAYDKQAAEGIVECPACGSHEVGKAIMAPNVTRRRSNDAGPQPVKKPVFSDGPGSKWARMAEAVREHVEKNYEYVGAEFPEEARRIHYGEAEERGIYGEATGEETKALLEEGIEVSPVPVIPKRNSN